MLNIYLNSVGQTEKLLVIPFKELQRGSRIILYWFVVQILQ